MAKILAIGAHPDDIEYYAGGTILRMSADNEVVAVVATDGGYGSNPKLRKKEQEAAAKIIGISKVIYLEYPDGKLEYQAKKLKKDFLKIILAEKPQIIFSFDPHNQHIVHGDFHPDHRILAHLITDIALIDATIAKLPRPQLWLYDAFAPNRKVNIRKVLQSKAAAIQRFKSQHLTVSDSYYEKFRVY